MNIVLENEYLKATITTDGAELISLISKSRDRQREIIWKGDKRYWGGHAPILFPACGGLWDGIYTLDGNPYQMPKHGFAKRMEWQAEGTESKTKATLILQANEDTMKVYPFPFQLVITYELRDDELVCSYKVSADESERPMPFQIGGHPSVMLTEGDDLTPVMGYLQPVGQGGETVSASMLSLVRVGEQGCWRPERYPVPTDVDGLIPICKETFHHEALIIDRNQICGFRVMDLEKNVLADIRSQAPVFLIWQPQDLLSPFVCVEPWYGLCDQDGHSTSLIERPYSQCAMPGNSREGILFRMKA